MGQHTISDGEDDFYEELRKRTERALDVIGRYQKARSRVEYHGTDESWKGAKLGDMMLERADFRGAYLSSVTFTSANLENANFDSYEYLDKDMVLSVVEKLQPDKKSGLTVENIKEAIDDLKKNHEITNRYILYAVRLKMGTRLLHANFQKANLHQASFKEAFMFKACLDKADLRQANLSMADLRHASFVSAKMENANLQKADLMRANLHNADLRGANLQGVNLSGANLQGAKLSGASFFPEPSLLNEKNLTLYLSNYKSQYIYINGSIRNLDNNLELLRRHMREEIITKINEVYAKEGYQAADNLLAIAMKHDFFAIQRVGEIYQKGRLTASQGDFKKAREDILKRLQHSAENNSTAHRDYVEWSLISNINILNKERVESALIAIGPGLTNKKLANLKMILSSLTKRKNEILEILGSDEVVPGVVDDNKLDINLKGADLSDMNLDNTDFGSVNLCDANLNNTSLINASFFPQENLHLRLPAILDKYQKNYAHSSNLVVLRQAMLSDLKTKLAACNEQDCKKIIKLVINHPLFLANRGSVSRFFNSIFTIFNKTTASQTIEQELMAVKPDKIETPKKAI